MKNTQPRKSRAIRLKSEDYRLPEDSTELQLAKTLSKLSVTEVKYSDLLSKIHRFISETSTFLDPILHTLPQKDQERLQSDIYYFLGINDSLYTTQLFSNFRQDLLEKLNFKDFSKETFKQYLLNKIQELYSGVGLKENSHKKKILFNDEKKELTPVRNMRRSTSPCEKTVVSIQKENTELKTNLSEIIKQRDLLKAWKENVIRFPNLEVEAQKIIKDCKEESELFAMKNNCNLSKLTYIVNSVMKFLKSTSKVQKGIREREGYLSWNFYEDERSKLELRLREVLESTDLNWKPPPGSPLRTFESEYKLLKTPELTSKTDLRRRSRDIQSSLNEKINSKLIEEITKQYTEKIETLNNQISKLETNNRKLKNKYYIVKKEMKQVKTSENQKKIEIFETFFNQKSTNFIYVKKLIEKNFSSFMVSCESVLKKLFNLIEEKNIQISEFKSILVKSLESNLNSINLLRVSSDEEKTKQSEVHKAQILSLKNALAQYKDHTEKKINDLEENLSNSETSNKKLLITIKTLETEISILTKEKNNFVDSEKTLGIQKEIINELVLEKDGLIEKVKSLQRSEALAQQLKFQKELLEREYSNLVKERNEEVKRLVDSDKRKSEVIDEMKVSIQGLEMENKQLGKALGQVQGYKIEDFEQEVSFDDNLPQIARPGESKLYERPKLLENLNKTIPMQSKNTTTPVNLTLSSTLPNQNILKIAANPSSLTPSASISHQSILMSTASPSCLIRPSIFPHDGPMKLESSLKDLPADIQKSELLKGSMATPQINLPISDSIIELDPKNVQDIQKVEAKSLKMKDFKQIQQNLKENSANSLKKTELEQQNLHELSVYAQVNEGSKANVRSEGAKLGLDQYKPLEFASYGDKSADGGLDAESLKRNLEMLKSELQTVKKQAIFVQVEKETVEIELKKVREHYKNFESFLKYRMLQLETGEIFMNRVDLNKYYCY